MTPFETIEIDEMEAACSGDGGPLGHPRVYLNGAPWSRQYPYCSRLFVTAGGRVQPGQVQPCRRLSDKAAAGAKSVELMIDLH